jgi:hypothetical protein
MAFWGAPLANPQHALMCVRAAVALQREIHVLNTRARRRISAEKPRGQRGASETALPLLPILNFGTGVIQGWLPPGLWVRRKRSL